MEGRGQVAVGGRGRGRGRGPRTKGGGGKGGKGGGGGGKAQATELGSKPLVRPQVLWKLPDDNKPLVFILAGQSNMAGRATQLPPDWQCDVPNVTFRYCNDVNFGEPCAKSSDEPMWIPLQTQHSPALQTSFYGPELTLARSLNEQWPNRRIHLIKFAMGSTNLHQHWNPEGSGANAFYPTFKEWVDKGLQEARSREARLAGFFWLQGESDSSKAGTANAYASNLAAFVSRVRDDFDAPYLPFVASRIQWRKGKKQHVVNAAIEAVTAADPETMACIDTLDLDVAPDGHFTGTALLSVGTRFGEAMTRLWRQATEPPACVNPWSPRVAKPVWSVALCVLPPAATWPAFLDIKQRHKSTHLKRPAYPHITVLAPWHSPTCWQAASSLDLLRSVVAKCEPFTLTCSSFTALAPAKRRANATLVLQPECEHDPAALHALHGRVAAAFPLCSAMGSKKHVEYVPHVGMGSFPVVAAATQAAARYEGRWTPVVWEVRHLYVMHRRSATDPFEVRAAIPLKQCDDVQPDNCIVPL